MRQINDIETIIMVGGTGAVMVFGLLLTCIRSVIMDETKKSEKESEVTK